MYQAKSVWKFNNIYPPSLKFSYSYSSCFDESITSRKRIYQSIYEINNCAFLYTEGKELIISTVVLK